MTRQERQTRKAQNEIDAFNERAPVGTAVLYWTGLREGPGREGRIRHLATILGGHTAVAWVDTHPACVALTHVEVITQRKDNAVKPKEDDVTEARQKCPRCDRPVAIATDDPTDQAFCGRPNPVQCNGVPVDWQARALAAEARLRKIVETLRVYKANACAAEESGAPSTPASFAIQCAIVLVTSTREEPST